MQPEKAKNSRPHHNRWLFLAIWMIGNTLSWIPYIIAEGNMSEFQSLIVLGTSFSIFSYGLIRWHFKRKLTWWIPLSTLASFAGTYVAYGYLWSSPFETLYTFMILSLIVALPAIPQAMLLHKYIKNAWLWVVSSVAASSVFAMILHMLDGGLSEAVLSFGLSSAVTGITLLWLFEMSQQTDKLKNMQDAEYRLSDDNKHPDLSAEVLHQEAKTRYL